MPYESSHHDIPLCKNVRMNFNEVAEFFLELGCETEIPNDDFSPVQFSPVHCALRNKNWKLTEMLLQYGADPNGRRGYQLWTPLLEAATLNSTDGVRLLLQCEADANLKGRDGETPLHLAAISNSVYTVEVLLEHGVDIEATNSVGRIPRALSAATERRFFSMVQLLIQHGGDVHSKDKLGKTPLIIAVESLCYPEYESACTTVVKTLLDHGSIRSMPLTGTGDLPSIT